MSDNKIEINFSILDNLHNFEHYTYMTQTVIKAIFINTVNYQRDNKKKIDFFEEYRKSPKFWGFFLCLENCKFSV